MPSPIEAVMMLPGVLMGFTFHEFGHALVATWFGDDTPRLQGRVSLDPRVHVDWLGVLLLVVVGFGWAKPVQVNTLRLRPRIWGDIAVSLAGVTMNFLLALLFYALYLLVAQYGILGAYSNAVLEETLLMTVWVQVILVGFNLIPLPPLDGFHVVRYLFPSSMDHIVAALYRFGPFLLVLFFASGAGRRILDPIFDAVSTAVITVVQLVL